MELLYATAFGFPPDYLALSVEMCDAATHFLKHRCRFSHKWKPRRRRAQADRGIRDKNGARGRIRVGDIAPRNQTEHPPSFPHRLSPTGHQNTKLKACCVCLLETRRGDRIKQEKVFCRSVSKDNDLHQRCHIEQQPPVLITLLQTKQIKFLRFIRKKQNFVSSTMMKRSPLFPLSIHSLSVCLQGQLTTIAL